jgi:hypothetical protein
MISRGRRLERADPSQQRSRRRVRVRSQPLATSDPIADLRSLSYVGLMRGGVRVSSLALLVTAACSRAPVEPAPQRINVEATGSSECLAEVTGALSDLHIAVAVMPVWQDDVGRMEFGPIELDQLNQVDRKLRAISCIQSFRQRACSTPNTDVDFCNAPVSDR